MNAPVAATPLDRAAAALRAFIVSVFPQALYWITHEYSVTSSDGLTFSGEPTDATFSPPLPQRVPYAPALAGSYSVVPAGTLAYVGFANADPGKPFLVRFGAGATSDATTIAASAVSIGDGFARAVREGDTYTATGAVPGTITLVLATTTDPKGPSGVKV